MSRGVPVKGHSFLVTGGGGFIGSVLARELAARGAVKVIAYDKLPAAGPPADSSGRFEYVQGDLADAAKLKQSLAGIDGLFHMAVLPLGPSNENPELALEVNVVAASRLFRLAAECGVKKIVYSSASSVYGDTLEVMDESHPLNCDTYYGITKLCAEYFLRPLKQKLSYNVLRYMNVYGPGQTAGLIPNVLKKINNQESPLINGDGSASFDFVHVKDVALCNVLAMEADVTAGTFNVGSGEEFSVKQIVEMLIEYSGSAVKPVYDRNAKVPMTRRVGSIEKAREILGYRPSVRFSDGLRELAQKEVAV